MQDDDPTVLLPRPSAARHSTRRAPRRRAAAIGAALLAAVLAAGGFWYLRRPAPPPALPLATEAQIDADAPQHLTLFRFAPNPRVLVFDFPTLLQQGMMFDRIAAFAEKKGLPHDRLLTDAELDHAIRAGGDTVATYYYGHDYSAATLRRFFALADRDHIALNAEEQLLHTLVQAQGMLAPDANQAVITLPRLGADSLVDASFRRTILHHELSHGEYFTDPAYADYVHRFFAGTMTGAEQATFQRFLVAQDYDPALHDLIVNETQAYMMHTLDRRAFSAAALGMDPAELLRLRVAFRNGMPKGWLRNDTPDFGADATPSPRPGPTRPSGPPSP